MKEGEPAPEAETQRSGPTWWPAGAGWWCRPRRSRAAWRCSPGDVVEQGPAAGLRPVPVRPRPLPGQPTHPAQIVGRPGAASSPRPTGSSPPGRGAPRPGRSPPGEREERAFLRLFGLRLPPGAVEPARRGVPVLPERQRLGGAGGTAPGGAGAGAVRPGGDPFRSPSAGRSSGTPPSGRCGSCSGRSCPRGAEILEEELRFTYTEEGCTVTARCRCWEEIGQIQEILVE